MLSEKRKMNVDGHELLIRLEFFNSVRGIGYEIDLYEGNANYIF